MATIAIAGAGVLGRLLAWQLAHAGHRVQVFDPAPGPEAPPTGRLDGATPYAAGFTAAGMLSPLAELDNAPPAIAALGWRSLLRWSELAEALCPGRSECLVRRRGSLLLAHGSDLGAAQRVLARLQCGAVEYPAWLRPQVLDCAGMRTLEPALAPDLKAWLLPGEGQLMPRELLVALARQAPGVAWQWNARVDHVEPRRMRLVDGQRLQVDLAIDTRGLGARGEAPGGVAGLRGVRGEVLWLHAPGVPLQHPMRLLHARHRVYLVPRAGDLVVVGASELESEDRSPVSLRSAVELMAAAHSLVPALAEARIVHMESNLRPALPDNAPLVVHEPGLLRINGLFRHGWLLAPPLVDDALLQCAGALAGALHA